MKPVYPAELRRMIEALENTPGATAPALRRAVRDRTAALPAEIAGYVEKVTLHAYRITDDDIAALKAAGYSEDAILEITYSAALGAGIARMDAGLAALHAHKEGR